MEEILHNFSVLMGRTPWRGPYYTALDFGCGVGRCTQALGLYFGRVLGVDVSSEMVELARGYSKDPNVRFTHNVLPNLSKLPTGNFDLVYSTHAIQHIRAPVNKAYVREFVRVLKPGGAAIFQVPAASKRPQRPLQRLAGSAKELVGLPVMDMVPIIPQDVLQIVSEAGASLAWVEPDTEGGPDWDSYTYFVVKA